MKKYILIIFFVLFCICSFLGGVHFNNFINNWDLLILTFGLLGFYLCLLENKITKELFLLFFLIFLAPLIFFSGLSLINKTLFYSINDWIGFLGAYFGIVGTLWGIWWQVNKAEQQREKEEEKDYKSCLKYIHQIVIQNLELFKENKIYESITFHILFSRYEEIINFIPFEKSIIEKFTTRFIEKEHICILTLNDTMKEIDKNLPIFYHDLEIKQNIFPFIKEKSEESKSIQLDKLPEENIIFSNFFALSGFIINGPIQPGYGPYLYYNNTIEMFAEEKLKEKIFKSYTAKNSLERINLKNGSFWELFLDYYTEIEKVFFHRPPFEDEQKQQVYSKKAKDVGLVHSHDIYKIKLLKQYENALNECDKKISDYLKLQTI